MLKIYRNRAFTLIEIMVVIALLWLMILIWLNFDFNKKNNTEKSERMINRIISIIDKSKIDSITWRWIYMSWVIYNPEEIVIDIFTWSISTIYSWSLITTMTWEIFGNPFFGEDKYEILKIEWFSKNWSSLWELKNLKIRFQWENTIFEWTDTSNNLLDSKEFMWFEISAWFSKIKKRLLFDRRNNIAKKLIN